MTRAPNVTEVEDFNISCLEELDDYPEFVRFAFAPEATKKFLRNRGRWNLERAQNHKNMVRSALGQGPHLRSLIDDNVGLIRKDGGDPSIPARFVEGTLILLNELDVALSLLMDDLGDRNFLSNLYEAPDYRHLARKLVYIDSGAEQ